MGCPLRSLKSFRVSSALPIAFPSHALSLTAMRLSKLRRRTLHHRAHPSRTAARYQFRSVTLVLQVSVSLPQGKVTFRHPRIVPRKVILQPVRKANPRHRVTSLARANLVLDNVKVVPGHLHPNRLNRLPEGSNAWSPWTLFIRHLPGELLPHRLL
jgi:hypothetical protein